MTTRKELIDGVGARYRSATLGERTRILDEFAAISGYHRKHAIRLVGAEAGQERSRPTRNRLYDEAVRQALIVLWEAGDRVCGKRLKVLIPVLIGAMERHGHLDLDAEIKAKLLQVSAATIDRALGDARSRVDGERKRRTGVGAAIRRSIPVRTFSDWRDPPPGFFEVDMVEHCGGAKTDGDFVHSLVLTDIASGWTECIAMPEQKNGAIVRRLVGYGRLSGLAATQALAQLYAAARLYVNFFQPSFKFEIENTGWRASEQEVPRPGNAV